MRLQLAVCADLKADLLRVSTIGPHLIYKCRFSAPLVRGEWIFRFCSKLEQPKGIARSAQVTSYPEGMYISPRGIVRSDL